MLFTATGGMAAGGAAVAAMILTIEGFVMGATKVLFDRAMRRARDEGHREGIREGIQRERDRLRQAGVEIPPDDRKADGNRDSARQS